MDPRLGNRTKDESAGDFGREFRTMEEPTCYENGLVGELLEKACELYFERLRLRVPGESRCWKPFWNETGRDRFPCDHRHCPRRRSNGEEALAKSRTYSTYCAVGQVSWRKYKNSGGEQT